MANGTNRFRPTKPEERRVARLQRNANQNGSFIRKPFLAFKREIYSFLVFTGIFGCAALLFFTLTRSGLVSRTSDSGLMLAFMLGLILAGGISSTLAFLSRLGHRLLLVALGSALAAAAGIATGLAPLELAAKLLFATSAGLWVGMMLTSIGQIIIISGLIILVDFYSVFLGPTKKLLESGGKAIDYFTINLPVFGAPAVSKIGVSDLLFYAVFLGCTLTYRLRRITTAVAMTASFIGTMIIGLTLKRGVPALPLLSVSFLLSNADLLYRRFLEEPDEQRKRGEERN